MLRWPKSRWALPLYAVAAMLAVAEIAVLWVAVHPQVSPEFRAYYIDRTTTCLPQPVTGAYTLGEEIDFRSGGSDTRELLSCGWNGPAGDGMHALGETSRLRFATGAAQSLTLTLEMTGVTIPGPPEQIVDVAVNETPVGKAVLKPGETQKLSFVVPMSALAGSAFADVRLDFPNAITPRDGIANNYKRSIKLVSASLSPTN